MSAYLRRLAVVLADKPTGGLGDLLNSVSGNGWSIVQAIDAGTRILRAQTARYVLIVEPEGPQPFNYRVRLTRDVPRPVFVWLTIGALILPPLVFWWRLARFEARRWEESDSVGTA